MATTDALTGLANHRGFHEVARRGARAAPAANDGRVALVTLDLDNFKTVNDTHGHPYGDEVLKAVGKKLRGAVRATDTAARVGGEEFALILPAPTASSRYRIAERARERRRRGVADATSSCSCSAGVATYPGRCRGRLQPVPARRRRPLLGEAARQAAHAPLRSRHVRPRLDRPAGGRDRRPARPSPTRSSRSSSRSSTWPAATWSDTRRWRASRRSPGRSPEALVRAGARLRPRAGAGRGGDPRGAGAAGRPIGTHLALNISPSALGSDPVAAGAPRRSSRAGDRDHRARVRARRRDPRRGAGRELRNRGARIAIDDAGAGYAGLKQMMRVRPDIVKLDRDLIRRIHADPARMALVESFVRFARRIGAIVCAEGIESLDDLSVLSDLDVQWGQGFALGRPAAPWALPSPAAARVCRTALADALRTPLDGRRTNHRRRPAPGAPECAACRRPIADRPRGRPGPDRRRAQRRDGLPFALAPRGGRDRDPGRVRRTTEERFPVADFPLTARVLRNQEAVQILVGGPARGSATRSSCCCALGHRSRADRAGGRAGARRLGIVEAFSNEERPWTRTEINRARIISNQFGSVILALFRSPAALSAWHRLLDLDPHLRRASSPPRACSRPSTATNSGPPNGWRPVIRSGRPGGCRARPGSAASPDRSPRPARTSPPAPGSSAREAPSAGRRPVELAASGSDRRAGRASGCRASPRSAPRAPPRCSARAPRPRRAPGPTASPRDSARKSSSRRWWRITSSATFSPGRCQLDALVGLVRDQPELVEPLHHADADAGRHAEPLARARCSSRAPRAALASA